MTETRKFRCRECGHTWDTPHETGRPIECPACRGKNIHRAEEEQGGGRGAGRRLGRGRHRAG